MIKETVKLSTLALAFCLVLSSCSKDESAPSTSKAIIVHASPNAPDVDLLVDNNKQNSAAVPYLTNTGYLTLNAGSRNIKVNAAGSSTSVINANLNFDANANYTIFAIDSVSKISAIQLRDTLTAPATGKSHVRFVHLSPNAPAVDIAVRGGSVVFGNRTFKQFSAFTPLDAGDYNLDVRVAGTTTVALALPAITLQAGKIYTVYARGFLGVSSGNQALGASIITHN